MNDLEVFLNTSWKLFDLTTDPDQGRSRYVQVPAGRSRRNAEARGQQPTNPLYFLSGVGDEEFYAFQGAEDAPFITMVVGHGGVGKTELLRQLCYRLKHRGEPLPVPIRLFRCKRAFSEGGGLLTQSENGDFAVTLFSHIWTEMCLDGSKPSKDFTQELVRQLVAGERFLLLDGLDELCSTPEEHRSFFLALMNMLCGADGSVEFKVVVSMRREYMLGAGDAKGTNAIKWIRAASGGRPVNVSFLSIEKFSLDEVEEYMKKTLEETLGEEAYDKIVRLPKLRDTLCRPFLLVLFCDLWNQDPEILSGEDLTEYTSAGKLIKCYVEFTFKEPQLTDDAGFSVRWNANKLAALALSKYRIRQENEIQLEEFREAKCVGTLEGKRLEDWQLEYAIYKCPFLMQAPEGHDVFRFSHDLFLEYFVARGVARELLDKGKREAFDELALPFESSRFLRQIIEEEHPEGEEGWHIETMRAYALKENQWHEWTKVDELQRELKKSSKEELFEELDTQRMKLLDYRNSPETEDVVAVGQTIDGLLGINQDCLHPRFRMYNYEAINVYVAMATPEEGYERRQGFLKVLEDCWQRYGTQPLEAGPLGGLVGRVLELGRLHRCDWARDKRSTGRRGSESSWVYAQGDAVGSI